MGQGVMVLPETGWIQIRYKKLIYDEGSDALKQAAQRSCGCPIHGGVQDQVGW